MRLRASTRSKRSARWRLAPLAGMLPLFILGACSSTPAPGTAATTSQPSTAPGAATSAGATTSSTTGNVPNYNPGQNARAFVKQTGCAMTGGTWVAKGTVANSTKSKHAFTIVVDFVTVPGNTVKDTEVAHVGPVDAGHTADWSVAAPTAQNNLTCIERFSQFSS